MMKRLAIVIVLGLTVTACTTARFAPTPPQVQPPGQARGSPQQQPPSHRDLGGPYTRDREDREFGQP
jgi:hypothetical protein